MRLRIAIVTALAALVAAVPASASGTLQVQKVDTSAFPTVRVTVQSPTPGKAPDLQVSENGVQVPPANVQMVDPGAPAAIALVIDTSNSMAGTKLNDAIAGRARLRQRPEERQPAGCVRLRLDRLPGGAAQP